MQLQYAYILKQLLPLILHNRDEESEIELETGVKTGLGANKIDILLTGKSKAGVSKIAIEMKCYRKIAASGGTRGAHDIFMKDVYEDLQMLEEYRRSKIASHGVALVMNDLERFVNPVVKQGKCWAYDISNGHNFPGGKIDVPIGGKNISIELKNPYHFQWSKYGELWFMEISAGQA